MRPYEMYHREIHNAFKRLRLEEDAWYGVDGREGLIQHFPSQIGPTCSPHCVADTVEYRYRIAFQKLGIPVPFRRLSVQYAVDGKMILPKDRFYGYKGTLINLCLELERGVVKAGGGLIDCGDYCNERRGRGEGKWTKTSFKFRQVNVPRFPVKMGEILTNFSSRTEQKIESIRKGLDDGPVYAVFYIYPGYVGYQGKIDYCDHFNGEPHQSYRPSAEEIKNGWETHAILLIGTGTCYDETTNSQRRYFVYRNSYGSTCGMNGYMRIWEDCLEFAWIPTVSQNVLDRYSQPWTGDDREKTHTGGDREKTHTGDDSEEGRSRKTSRREQGESSSQAPHASRSRHVVAESRHVVAEGLDHNPGCLAPLVKKIHEAQVLEMTNKLCDKLLNGKDQNRDIASIAVKAIVSEVPSSSVAQSVLVSVSSKLIKGITSLGTNTDIKCECLDILCDVLHKFGNLMASDHELLLSALLPQLCSNQASVRKKTVSCIASLASTLFHDLVAKATIQVIRLLESKGSEFEMTRTNIQIIEALSRAVGYRFGPHLLDTVPILIKYCTSASENDEELWEYSVQALESFLLRCPRDILSYCNEILHLNLEYLSYDPNFTDNMEEDTDDDVHDEEEDDESGNECKDDEDISWKVRRAFAKCLAGFIVSWPEMLTKLYDEACLKLIDRFKEREENVKMDVFSTFIELLRQTGNVTKRQTDINELSPRWPLKQGVPKIINKKLSEKSIKTKIVAFSVLKELVVVLPYCLADHIRSLIPRIEKVLCDKSSTSNLKIEALAFTRLVLAFHSPAVFHPYIKVIGFDFNQYAHPIYNAIMTRLTNQDQDQEVEECAIYCMGLVVSTFGDNLRAELPSCLPVLVDRMGNEITRLTAVKAFAVISASPLQLEFTTFLRMGNLALRQATLETLNTLIVAYGDKIGSAAYEVIIVEHLTLISDLELHMTALALELCCALMSDRRSNPNFGLSVRNKLLPQAMTLVKMLTDILKDDSTTNSVGPCGKE